MDKKAQEKIAKFQCLIEHIGHNQVDKNYQPDIDILWVEHKSYQEFYLYQGKVLLELLERLGYRKLPKGKPLLLSDEELIRVSNKLDTTIGFKADFASENQRVIAQAQREADIKFYTRGANQ